VRTQRKAREDHEKREKSPRNRAENATSDHQIADGETPRSNSTISRARCRVLLRYFSSLLGPFGVYYDRRKNSQKQQGRPVDRIISISFLAQSVMAIALQRPDDARARPSSLIKNEEDYVRLFSSDHPISLYLVAAKLAKSVVSHLRARDDLAPKDRNNLLFYVAMHSAACLVGIATPKVQALSDIKVEAITEDVLTESVKAVEVAYKALGGNDQVAKGPQLVLAVKQDLSKRFPVAPAA
jgi:hypothetical protein